MLIAALALMASGTLVLHAGSAALALSRRPTLRKGPAFRPFISLIRPVKGFDPLDRETLESSFHLDYDGSYEIIFCVESEDDPAVTPLRQMIRANPDVPARLLTGLTMVSANPKLNNLAKGVAAARSDWLVMTDANLLLAPDYLTGLTEAWGSDTGLVSGPPLGADAENFWGAVEGAFLNTNQARWQLAADALGRGFAQGKTMMWNARVLAAGGGLAALGRDMAEDIASTKLVRAQGLSVRLPEKLSFQPIGRRTARAVWDRQLRWSRVRRDGFPALFGLEIAQGPVVGLATLVALAGLGGSAWVPTLFLLAWYGIELAFARGLGLALTRRDLAAMVTRDALLPALWLATFARRGFEWRGTAVDIRPQAQ